MNGNLGRDKIWTNQPQIWADIDKALNETIGPVRVAQKVFPTISTPGAPNVTTNQALPAAGVGDRFVIPEAGPVLFLEISTQFLLTQNQVDNESTLHSAIDAVRDASRRLAQAEDLLIFNGQAVALPPGVTVTNLASARNGLLGEAFVARPVPQNPAPAGGGPPVPVWQTYNEVMQGISVNLDGNGRPAPFALVLAPLVHGDTTSPFMPTVPVTVRDRLLPELKGGIYSSVALAGPGPALGAAPVGRARTGGGGGQVQHRGLLISLAGNPTTLQVAQDAVVQYIPDTSGNHIFRVVERIQWVARDAQALVRLEFM